MTIAELLLKLAVDWKKPKSAARHPEDIELPLRCTVEQGPAKNIPPGIPEALASMWSAISSARLFEDVTYGQWGLILLSPDQAKERTAEFHRERREAHRVGDLVIGEFRGDRDLLVIRCNAKARDFGKMQVVMEIDSRSDAPYVGDDLEAFLVAFARDEGAKFWEPQSN